MKKLFDLFFPNRPSPEKRLEALVTTYHHARISAELDLIDAEAYLTSVKRKAEFIELARSFPDRLNLVPENRQDSPSRNNRNSRTQ